MKYKPITFLLFCLLCMPIQMQAQKNVSAATIEQLEKEMYRLYPTRNVDEFIDVTDRLKEASLKAGNEGLFYRAWANQAYFLFSKIDRQKGMEEDNILYFCLGDVSGKGVPASLFMAQTIRLFRALAKQHMMPDAIATRLNDELTEKNDNGMFVTMFIGQMDLTTGKLHFCNAGHNPPVIGGDELHGSFLEMEPNAPIGLWPELEYIGEEIESVKGHPLFIYSDGLNEAENTLQEQFGDDHMLDILRHTKFKDARHVVELMEAEVERHRHGAEPNDDMTIMCLKALNIKH